MSTATATIRELRTDFRAVKRKLEQHGSLVITDNGVPRYEMKPLTSQRNGRVSSMPDRSCWVFLISFLSSSSGGMQSAFFNSV